MNRIIEGILRGAIPWWIIYGTDFNSKTYLYERNVKAWFENTLSFNQEFASFVTSILFVILYILILYNLFKGTCKFFIGLKHGDERLPW